MATQYNELAYRPDPTTGQGQQVWNPTSGKAYSTPEQLAGDLGIQSTAIDWSKIGNINGIDIGSSNMSAADIGNYKFISPTTGNYDNSKLMDTTAAQIAGWQATQDNAQKNLDASMAGREGAQTSMAGTVQQQYQQYGIADTLGQIKSLTSEASAARDNLNAIQKEASQSMLNEEGRSVSLSTIRGSQSIIQKQYDLRIAGASAVLSSKSMQIEALQGNLSMAKSFADEMITALTYDAKQKVDNLDFIINYNQDLIKSMGTKVESGINTMRDLAQSQYDEQKTLESAKAELALTYPTVAREILAAKTLEEAIAASQPAAMQLWNQEQAKNQASINASNRSNQPEKTTGTSYYEIAGQSAIDSGLNPSDAFQAALKIYAQLNPDKPTMEQKDQIALWAKVSKMTKATTPATTTTPTTTNPPTSYNPLNISTPTPKGLQNTSLAGQDAGNGNVWTADGRIVTKAQYEKELKKATPTYMIQGEENIFNTLFGTDNSKLTVK